MSWYSPPHEMHVLWKSKVIHKLKSDLYFKNGSKQVRKIRSPDNVGQLPGLDMKSVSYPIIKVCV